MKWIKRWRRYWMAMAGGMAVLLCLAYLHHVDWPAFADPVPEELSHALGSHAGEIKGFHRYLASRSKKWSVSNFVFDADELWCFDVEPENLKRIVAGLRLESVDHVPEQFWTMSPYYWPRQIPRGAGFFQSSSSAFFFPVDTSCYLVFDPDQNKAYVSNSSRFNQP